MIVIFIHFYHFNPSLLNALYFMFDKDTAAILQGLAALTAIPASPMFGVIIDKYR